MERALTIQLESNQLLGILHEPAAASGVGVVIVVGGPQYRVGSHRQFIQLSRALALEGIPSLRFDYRGMGDSEGEKQPFDDIGLDIKAACDAFCQQTGLARIILWGLCDAASAAMIYASEDCRVEGLVLLNPWLRSEETMARTMVHHYYLQRLLSRDFWVKMLGGKVQVLAGLKDARGYVKSSLVGGARPTRSYQARMQAGISLFEGQICLILSGNDLTAREFELQALGARGWPVFASESCALHRLKNANHTFSEAGYKRDVERISVDFVRRLASESNFSAHESDT